MFRNRKKVITLRKRFSILLLWKHRTIAVGRDLWRLSLQPHLHKAQSGTQGPTVVQDGVSPRTEVLLSPGPLLDSGHSSLALRSSGLEPDVASPLLRGRWGFFLAQPGMLDAFFAARTSCWLAFSLSSWTPMSFLEGCFSASCSPACAVHGVLVPRCRTWHYSVYCFHCLAYQASVLHLHF